MLITWVSWSALGNKGDLAFEPSSYIEEYKTSLSHNDSARDVAELEDAMVEMSGLVKFSGTEHWSEGDGDTDLFDME